MGCQPDPVAVMLKFIAQRDKGLDIASAPDDLDDNVKLKIRGGDSFERDRGCRSSSFLARDWNQPGDRPADLRVQVDVNPAIIFSVVISRKTVFRGGKGECFCYL